MNTDSSTNVVVFEVLIGGRLQQLLGECSTRAADGVREVWGVLATSFNLRPADVRRVYSQWEPTTEDRAFLATVLQAAVKVSYSFRRPLARRDWGKPTPKFARVVDKFERSCGDYELASSSAGVAEGGSRPQRSRRSWWQYWDWPGEATNPFTGESH